MGIASKKSDFLPVDQCMLPGDPNMLAGEAALALEKNPNSMEALHVLVDALLKLGEYSKAQALVEDAKKEDPDSTMIKLLDAQFLYQTQDYDKAHALLVAVWEQYNDNMVALYNLGLCKKELGDDDGATWCFMKVVSILPNHAPAHFELGRLYLKHHYSKPAVFQFFMALKVNPVFFQAYLMLGFMYEEDGCLDFVISLYRLGANAAGGQAILLRTETARLLYTKGDLPGAIAEMTLLCEDIPHYDAFIKLGLYYQEGRRSDLAINAFNQAVALDGENWEAYFRLAMAHESDGDLTRAMLQYKKAIKVSKSKAYDPLNNLGLIELGLAYYKDAEVHLLEAVRNYPDRPEALLNLAILRFLTGKQALGVKLANAVLERSDPSQSVYQEAVAVLQDA